MSVLVRRLLFRVGEFVAEDRLEIRGIFVGVSFDRADDTFSDDDGGASFGSRILPCEIEPTLGEPAMVGS